MTLLLFIIIIIQLSLVCLVFNLGYKFGYIERQIDEQHNQQEKEEKEEIL